MTLDARRQRALRLGEAVATIDTPDLLARLDAASGSEGWGSNRVLEVAGERAFVKRIRVTDRELRRAYGTRNVNRLPVCYQYGVGSAGFNVFRELAAHVRTSNWVLAGETDHFPLLLHHRIVEVPPAPNRFADPAALDGYVRYWNGSRAVRNYMTERAEATHELLLVLEYFPHSMPEWLGGHRDQTRRVFDDLLRAADLMHARGMIHFDAHFMNVVTDGETTVLTDFGLALGGGFELTARERAFFDAHRLYDHCHILGGIGATLFFGGFMALDAERRDAVLALVGEPAGRSDPGLIGVLLSHLEALAGPDLLDLPDDFVELAARTGAIAAAFGDLHRRLGQDRRKAARFDQARMRRLLRKAAIV